MTDMHTLSTPDLQTQTMTRILSTCRTVAVVGLSPKAHRDSYQVAQYMQAQGWRIVPVNPVVAASGARILGEPVYPSLSDAARCLEIDLVNVFRNSDEVPLIVDEALGLGLPAIWLQLGIKHVQAVAKARAAGMQVVQDRCLKVEQARYQLGR